MPPAFNLSQDQTLQFNLSKKSLKLTLTNKPHHRIHPGCPGQFRQ
jgi:hypothetical protein